MRRRNFPAVFLILVLLGGSLLNASCKVSNENKTLIRQEANKTVQEEKKGFVSHVSQKRIEQFFSEVMRLSPRPPGSEKFKQCGTFLMETLKGFSLKVWTDKFTPNTPKGPIPMQNVIAEKKGSSGSIIYLASHIDTKKIGEIDITGANDSGSSTAALLELAKVLSTQDTFFTYRFAFFDGEESIGENMDETDGLYGSKEHVRRIKKDRSLLNVRAMILLDMIGDKDLVINRDNNSSSELYNLFVSCCLRLGYKSIFGGEGAYMYDDHFPFLQERIASLDIIDFDYGPDNSFWHTVKDNVSNISVESMFKITQVVACMLDSLEKNQRD